MISTLHRHPARIAALAVSLALLAACGDSAAEPSSAPTVAPTAVPDGGPAATLDGSGGAPTPTAPPESAASGSECLGLSTDFVTGLLGDGAVASWEALEQDQDTSRGVVRCRQEFTAVPEAGVGDLWVASVGATYADSSRYVDGSSMPVTLDTYRSFAVGAMPMTFGDDAIAWGMGDDSEASHYRYIAFAKGDLVVMVYAGFEPAAAPGDWSTADSMLEGIVTQLANQIDASGLTAADLPAQEAVVPVTTAPQG